MNPLISQISQIPQNVDQQIQIHWITHNALRNNAGQLWQEIFTNLVIFIILVVYSGLSYFFILDLEFEKLHFTNLANPKNPNPNLDSTDYGCEIRLLFSHNW